jgi:hypothetical protein
MFARFSPSISPDKHDLLLPLPHGGRRSPRSRMYAFLVNDELPTIGTRGYTDESCCEESEDELCEALGCDHWYCPNGKTVEDFNTSSHADRADTIIELCVDSIWDEKAKECDLKGSIIQELAGGCRRDAIDDVLSDFLDQALAEEELSEAKEDLETAVERLDEEKEFYKQHCHAAAQMCLSKQLVWGAAHVARIIASGNHFPANSAAVFKPRISAALLCSDARKHVLLSGGLLSTLAHRIASPGTILYYNAESAQKNRDALAQRACGCSFVARLSRTQISHNVSRWLARLDVGSSRFAQRSLWLLRDQGHKGSSDDEQADICIRGEDSEEEVDQDNCNAEKVKVENKIQEVEDLVTVRLIFVFCLNGI